MPEPGNANSLRGAEFKQLITSPKGWVWVLVAVVLGFAFGLAIGTGAGAGAGMVIGLIAAAILGLIAVGIIFWVADTRAANAFFASYAEARGLTWHKGGAALDGSSAFLRKGDSRRVNQLFTGELAPGIEGSLALYTYTEESTDSDGQRSDTNYPFTVVTARLPETAEHMRDLRVQRKSGFKALEGFEDKFRTKHERVTLESEKLRDRYEIFVAKDQDPVWTRRLFSPTFIVWLTEEPPKKFAFEIESGYFVAYIPKHRQSADSLDEMVQVSCQAADRIRTEVAETSPRTEREP